MNNRCLFLLLVAFLFSCSQRMYNESTHVKSSGVEGESDGRTELIQFLREQPSLRISGFGGSYEMLVRGARSINGPNEPLYTLDGVQLGRDYNSVAGSVDVTQIASIRVITPANAAIYGSQGSNGVIAIKTKS